MVDSGASKNRLNKLDNLKNIEKMKLGWQDTASSMIMVGSRYCGSKTITNTLDQY